MKRGELWWAELGKYRPLEQTGRRPVIIWQSDSLTRILQSVLVIPLTTNPLRARLAGTAVVQASETGPAKESVALAFQLRAVPKTALKSKMRSLNESELAEIELAIDEALGRLEPGAL